MHEKSNFLLTTAVLGLIIISLILAFSKPEIEVSTAQTDKDTISVTGSAEVTTMPDKAELYVRIETEDLTATEAKDMNARITDDVIKVLKRKGVKNEDIETYQFNLRAKQKWDRDTETYITTGYVLTNVLKVTATDLDKTGLLIDTAVDSGANGVDRISFTLTKQKQKEVNAEALRKASLEAEDKAKDIAKALNLKLGKISRITESNYVFTPYEYAPIVKTAIAVEEASTQISPQKLEVRATISIVYNIG